MAVVTSFTAFLSNSGGRFLSRFRIQLVLSTPEPTNSSKDFPPGDKCKNSMRKDCSFTKAGITTDRISLNTSPTGSFPSCSLRSRSLSARDNPSEIGDRDASVLATVPARLIEADRTVDTVLCDSLTLENINSRSSDIAFRADDFHCETKVRKSSLYDLFAGDK